MAGIALCKTKDCIKKYTCKRIIETIGEVMNMEAVCNESNNYERYWHVETQLQTTEEIKAKTKENIN